MVKHLPANAVDIVVDMQGLIPGLGRSPAGDGNLLQLFLA